MIFKLIETKEDFDKYSYKLKEFECEFSYPLGNKKFYIKHGLKNNSSYFDFFNRLGEVRFFLILENEKVLGAGCAILRTYKSKEENIDYWYLCDFKLSKEIRGKGILKKICIKYFLQHYLKANRMIAINMSPVDKNGLVKTVKRIFSWFNVRVKPYYFYEWDSETFYKNIFSNQYIKENYVLFTNDGLKDIEIEGETTSLYHLVRKDYAKEHLKDLWIPIEDAKNIDGINMFMLSTEKKSIVKELEILGIKHTSESSFISYKMEHPDLHFSSGEI